MEHPIEFFAALSDEGLAVTLFSFTRGFTYDHYLGRDWTSAVYGSLIHGGIVPCLIEEVKRIYF
jgi:hypothetical protein